MTWDICPEPRHHQPLPKGLQLAAFDVLDRWSDPLAPAWDDLQASPLLAVGDGPPDLPDFKMPVQPGDRVVFPRSAGVWVEIDDERLRVCRMRELLGVIDGAPAGS